MLKSFRDEDAIRCVNCGLRRSFKRLQVSSLPEADKQLLTDWLPTVENLQDCVICEDCAALLGAGGAGGAGGARRRAHAAVCPACGDSLRRRRHYAVQEGHHLYPLLAPYCHHFRGDDFKNVCFVCVTKARSMVEKNKQRIRPYIDPCLKDSPEALAEIQSAWEKTTSCDATPDVTATSSSAPVENFLTLKYHKLANKEDSLCAAECQNKGDKLASLITRQRLLIHQSLYAPVGTRVCLKHQRFANWTEETRRRGHFTGTEIVDMLFLLKRDLAVNFSDVENMDPQLRRKWLGVRLEKFVELYDKSTLRDKSDGKFALALALASAHTREPDVVLASVGQRSLQTIQDALKLAKISIDMDDIRTALEALKYEEMD